MSIHPVDLAIFIVYLVFMLGVGFYFLRKNKSDEDYYVGSRSMSAGHIGLSVVATDVGGGFSIGLGGLGFAMGISGSWMLLTGLIGAWLSAVWLIPKVYPVAREKGFMTFPQALSHHYNPTVVLIAAWVSFIGYIGFTSSQILAGAKLATATFPALDVSAAVWIMGVIAVVYTVIGGIKAVIYTDTIQWLILLCGLVFIGLPIGYMSIGGIEGLRASVGPEFLSLRNLSVSQFINWFITIVPIWFVGMTLYQRIFASRDEKTAVRAWRIAGFFEWPIMAFMGVFLGLFARVAFQQGMFTELGYAPGSDIDAEVGLPLLLRSVLPVGLMGLMMAAYFSAIMSTADSCLMAASGNLTGDILKKLNHSKSIRSSQWFTLFIGTAAIAIALYMENVLELMLHSYAFMVAGLLVPVVAMLVIRKPSPVAAVASMISGGGMTLFLTFGGFALPGGLDPVFYGLLLASVVFVAVQGLRPKR